MPRARNAAAKLFSTLPTKNTRMTRETGGRLCCTENHELAIRNIGFQSVCPAGLKPAEGQPTNARQAHRQECPWSGRFVSFVGRILFSYEDDRGWRGN